VSEVSTDAAVANLRRWREEPVAFCREVLRLEPDAWQARMLAAFPTSKRMVASACKGPGKTALMSWLGWNFLLTRPHCKVPCTSITGPNLKDGLWTEFRKWQNRSELLQQAFVWTQTRIFARQHPETWWASARTWAQDADPQQQANTLAGLHEDYLLFLLDEVSDYPEGVVAAAEGALTSGVETKLVMMGNPTRTDGPLYRAVTVDAKHWHITRITSDPLDPDRTPRVSVEEANAQIEKYGRDSYIVRVNILGQFPDRQADKLLDIADCLAASQRHVVPATYESEPRILGLDVARHGDDAAVLQGRQGRVAFMPKEFRGLRTDELGEQLIRAMEKWDADAAFVDTAGMGVGVLDYCISRGYGARIFGVNNGERALEPNRFENKRAETAWACAEWVKGGGCLPKDSMLHAELAAPVYWYDKRGRVCIERKEEVKPRLGRSPDRADALWLTLGGHVSPRRRHPLPEAVHGRGHRAQTEYDVLA